MHDVGELLYRRLLTLNDQAVPSADLGSGFSISEDGLSYHVPLVAGQQWSNGNPITVADVLATVTWLQSRGFGDPATASPWLDVHARRDGNGVTFDLAGPRASFPAQLTQLPVLPLGSLTGNAVQALRSTSATAMPSSGLFRVVSNTATAITLSPNPHGATAVHLNQVEIDLYASFAEAAASFRAGKVDGIVATDPVQRSQLLAAGGMPHDISTFRFVDLLFNQRGPVLGDSAVRQAIAASIDRAQLVSGPLRGAAAPQVGPFPAGIAWAVPPQAVPTPDRTLAGATLDAAGWKTAVDGVRAHGSTRLQVRLAVADVVPLPALAAVIVTQLRTVAMDVTVTTMPAAAVRQLLVSGANFDLALADWENGPDPDVSSYWRSTAVPPAGFNVSGGTADPFLDQALDRLATLTTASARMAAAATVSSQLADDLPAVFLETPRVSLVLHPGISVVVPPVGDSSARFAHIAGWHRG